MATNYTYSFNCTIKYTFTNDVNSTAFDDSINLVTYESEETELTKLMINLPAYLQGGNEQIKWYTDAACTNQVTENMALAASAWTLSNRIQIGSFISYDATITLVSNSYKTSVTWEYKSDEGDTVQTTVDYWASESPLDSPPEIPLIATVKAGDKLTVYTFVEWVANNDTSYTAVYNKSEYTSTNPFAIKNLSPYSNAEPYLYGTVSDLSSYFKPLGSEIQIAEQNGYSNLKSINELKINSKPLQYIEKGTFPVPRLLTSYQSPYTSAGEAASEGYLCKLQIKYVTSGTNKGSIQNITVHQYKVTGKKSGEEYANLIKASDNYCQNEVVISKTNGNFTLHGHAGSFPARLGFILTGGGGGAGGVSRIDPKKDGKDNDYTSPGGGGGGAETICGVFDITKPTGSSYSTNTFVIYLGNGGAGGAHGQADASYDNPSYGTKGNNGNDSIIWWVDPSNNKLVELYRACGGFAGDGGGWSTGGSGGRGGSYAGMYSLRQNKHNCILCKQVKGGAGGSPINGYTTSNEALSMKLYFSNTPPEENAQNSDKFYISCNYSADQHTHDPSDLSLNANVAGGHSFGKGATSTSNPSRGSGGCCNLSGGRDGAGGFFGLYY